MKLPKCIHTVIFYGNSLAGWRQAEILVTIPAQSYITHQADQWADLWPMYPEAEAEESSKPSRLMKNTGSLHGIVVYNSEEDHIGQHGPGLRRTVSI